MEVASGEVASVVGGTTRRRILVKRLLLYSAKSRLKAYATTAITPKPKPISASVLMRSTIAERIAPSSRGAMPHARLLAYVR